MSLAGGRQRWGPVLVLAAAALALLAASAPRADAIFDPARERSCGWLIEPSSDRENILFPDTGTRYLAGIFPAPPGGHVEIKGQYPHARYMSLQTYSHTLQVGTDLYDEQIEPDPGSVNPFLPGADRTNPNRDYTVRLVGGPPPPGGGPPNTLYSVSADGTRSGNGLAYRMYYADRDAGPFGGVPAPAVTFVLANGTRIPIPTCPDLIPDIGLTQLLASLGLNDYLLPPIGLLARREPIWHKYVNAPTSYALGLTENEVIPPELSALIAELTAALPSGLGENAHIKYVYAYLSQEFGKVVRFRAKLPTTPRTRDGQSAMGTGQMRYWSICTANRTTQTYGCAIDEEVPLDENGYFTVAVSTASNRPANAVPECGVAWLPWGLDPKGIVFVRNMLPDPGFAPAIQNAEPGTEAQTMGEYHPAGTYFAGPNEFEREVGCDHGGSVPGGGAGAAAPAPAASAPAKKLKKKKRAKKRKKKQRRKRRRG